MVASSLPKVNSRGGSRLRAIAQAQAIRAMPPHLRPFVRAAVDLLDADPSHSRLPFTAFLAWHFSLTADEMAPALTVALAHIAHNN